MRRAAKADANQPLIVMALRDAGATVYYIKEPCDLLVGFQGRNFLMEIKDPSRKPSERKLTDNERVFHALWRGQVCIIETMEEALRLIA